MSGHRLPRHRFRPGSPGATPGSLLCVLSGCGLPLLDPAHVRAGESPLNEPEADGTYVRTLLTGAGRYKVAVTLGDRVLVWLPGDRAVQYAATLSRQIAAAASDAAVVGQLRHMGGGLDDQAVGAVLTHLRGAREEPDPGTTAPLEFVPGVSLFTGRPFLGVRLDGKLSWQWDLPEAREHMAYVLESAAVATLDTEYRRVLIEMVGLDPDVATTAVGDLHRFREDAPPDTDAN